MNLGTNKHRALLSWLFVCALLALCGVLGVLQYRWIGEVSIAARQRLQGGLQANLNRLSDDFNSEIAADCRQLLPNSGPSEAGPLEPQIAERYAQWKTTARHPQMFARIAVAAPNGDAVLLRTLDFETGRFRSISWPDGWQSIQARLESWISGERWQDRTPGAVSPPDPLAVEIPFFATRPAAPGPFDRRDMAWLILELNADYLRSVILPEQLHRHLGADYQAVVRTRSNPPAIIYESDANQANRIAGGADASVGLFDLRYERVLRGFGPQPGGESANRGSPRPGTGRPFPGRQSGPEWAGRGPGEFGRFPMRAPSERTSGAGPGPGFGRWQMLVRHRAGSLEAVVSRARIRNLAVTGGVLLLMMATVAALLRFTRRSQKLAELQMDFVAGVSHELRTPLTVIHTAAYNLRSKVASNPAQVEQYGALIQQESGRLKELVEQVLSFAGANAGCAIKEPRPVSVETLIEDTVESSREVLQASRCTVEKKIEAGLPLVLGDAMALKHVLQNLLSNAAKYGAMASAEHGSVPISGGAVAARAADNHWIGISALASGGREGPGVEIRVADHGPGIPEDEQAQIFDPFFRGRRALQDQIHGTGLGLNVAKKIVEAHGGSIRVRSVAMNGTEFIVRLPAIPNGAPG